MTPCREYRDEFVCAGIIRQFFNELKIWEQAKHGTLRMCTAVDVPQKRPLIGEPCDLRKQIVYYIDIYGETVAVVHQIVRPDGSIAASGLPDPKFLRIGCRRLKYHPCRS